MLNVKLSETEAAYVQRKADLRKMNVVDYARSRLLER